MIARVRNALVCAAVGAALLGAGAVAPDVLAQAAATPQEHAEAEDPGLNDLLVKAQADVDNQDYDSAAQKYQTYLAQRPQDAQIHFQLGYCYTALQKPDQARTEYEKAAELNPNLSPAFLNLGLTELSSDPASAVAAFTRAVELMPNDEKPKLLLATALAHSGKTDEAIAQFQAAEKINDQDVQVHLGLADALVNAGRLPDAEREYRAAAAIEPGDAQVHLALGECLIAQTKYDDGANELGAYLDAHPEDDKVRLAQVSALISEAKYRDALTALGHASAITQNSLPALKLRYDALEGAKRYDDAAATLAQAESIAPQDPEVHAKIAHLALDKKDYAQAAREFIAVLKLQPQNTDALAGLVTSEYFVKDYPDTLKAVDLLSQQAPLSAPTLFIRADCYDKLGKKPEALDAYEKFLSVNSDHDSDMYFAAAERARELRREIGKK
ncbi:MAG TPA: tetratricopeptide repeat protein [Candidatus Aquilonibacter sp.]|nr:tetratricopeptide repeat protein [Candidatus Aquilonibacter sp.]